MTEPAEASPPPGALGYLRVPVLLTVVAIFLYGTTIGWGVPHATAADRTKSFATDSILPLEALAEMHNTFIVSKPDRNYGYPWWHYFVVASAQAPYVGFLLLTGDIEEMDPIYPFGMKDPVTALRWLTFFGRAVSILMAAGIVFASYLLASTLWGPRAGTLAGMLTMLSYPMLYYSGTGNLDVPLAFWTTLGLVCFARILELGLSTRRAVWLGVLAAVAMATKDQAFVVFVPLGFALLFPGIQGTRQKKYAWTPLLAGLTSSIVVYVIATGMLVDPGRHVTHLQRVFFHPEMMTAADAYFSFIPKTPSGFCRLVWEFVVRMSDAVSLPVLLVAIGGAFISARSHPRALVFLLPLPAMLLLVNLPLGAVVLRYFVPLVPVICGFAALALVRMRRRWGIVWTAPLFVMLAWQALIGGDLAQAQFRETRYDAAEWLEANAQSGAHVEYFGPSEKLPHLGEDIESHRVAGRETWTREVDHGPRVLDYLLSHGPDYVLVIPDWTSLHELERSRDCPPEVFQALTDGSVGYYEAARFSRKSWLPWPITRPPLDNPSVSPPVRIFARAKPAPGTTVSGEAH